jgi:ferredoxin-thioredoxin reductase catalytic subunit
MKVIVTDDKDLATEIRRQLKENDGYCPCRLDKTPDTKCMCKEFRDQVDAGIPGTCHCGLYIATI